MDISKEFAGWPVIDTSYFRVVWNLAFVAALVFKDNNLRYYNEELLGRDSGTSMA